MYVANVATLPLNAAILQVGRLQPGRITDVFSIAALVYSTAHCRPAHHAGRANDFVEPAPFAASPHS
jgi:hypothetical protein